MWIASGRGKRYEILFTRSPFLHNNTNRKRKEGSVYSDLAAVRRLQQKGIGKKLLQIKLFEVASRKV